MVEAYITRTMLTWARERLNESRQLLAQKMHIKPAKLEAWEDGIALPSTRQAQELANKLRIPLGYLYLSTPPVEDLPLPDLRTMANAPIQKPSPDFLDVIYDAFRKQQWYREYLIGESVPKIEFIGKFNLTENPLKIAADIQATLGIDDELRRNSFTWEQFLTRLIRQAEAARVLVLRNGVVGNNTYRKLDIQEFRGFAICDDIAPLVFINGSDYKTAQIFTLVHELVHLWVGQSGISNPDYMLRPDQQSNQIDQLCDNVAAEVLVPRDMFVAKWDDLREIDYNLNQLAASFRVSSFVILRRGYTLDIISTSTFHSKYNELLTKVKPKRADSGGDFHNLLRSRNSPTLTNTLITGVAEGTVSPPQAARLLNVRIGSLHNIESHILVG